jgi:hypothetical protein
MQGSPLATARTRVLGGWVANPNFQQPYYQTTAYGPNMQPAFDSYYLRLAPIPLSTKGVQSNMTENVRDQVARTLREYGLEPRCRVRAYQKPYPKYFNTIPYSRGFRVLDFIKFTGGGGGRDSKTTSEHVGQFLAQVSNFGIMDMHKVRLFPLSLTGTTFN